MAKRVKQRGGSDCCIAAIANATNNTYKAVKKKYGRMDRNAGLDHHETCWLLGEFCDWKLTEPRKPPVMVDWLRRHKTGRYVVILHVFLDDNHAVAVIDGVVHGHYAKSWRIIQYFTVLEANNDRQEQTADRPRSDSCTPGTS